MPQSKPLKDLRKQLFPTPPKYTSEEVDKIWLRYQGLSQHARMEVNAKIHGVMAARVNTPQKSYQISARLFFMEVDRFMNEAKQTNS